MDFPISHESVKIGETFKLMQQNLQGHYQHFDKVGYELISPNESTFFTLTLKQQQHKYIIHV